jgi:hypothetical protein
VRQVAHAPTHYTGWALIASGTVAVCAKKRPETGGVRMRGRLSRSEGPGWGVWLAGAAVLLLLAGAVALTIYGGTVRPQQHEVEQVITNDRFSR